MGELTLPSVQRVVTSAVETGRVPGAITAVVADGKVVHLDARGVYEPGSAAKLAPDSILWLASLSKVVCAAAVLTVADDGKLSIEDPVSRFVPEFAAPGRVRVLPPGTPPPPPDMPFGPPPDPIPPYLEVPAEREITVRDLLTQTSGLQSIFQWNPDYAPARPGETLADHVAGLARVVRDFQPGTKWAYSNGAGFDVLGRVAEAAAGVPFAELVRSRLLEPLGIESMDFALGRAPRAVLPNPMMMASPNVSGDGFASGSVGLWGDATSFLRFGWMLRDGRAPDGREVLSPEAVRQMTTNQVGDLHPDMPGRPEYYGLGFGFSLAVVNSAAEAGLPFSDGSFGWQGISTRWFWVDPARGFALYSYVPDTAVQQDVEAAVVADLAG